METRISNVIDLTDDEFPSSMNSKLRAENQDLVRRNADLISCTHELERRNLDLKSAHSNLEAKLADMQEENERLKADLKDTRAMLGEAVVSAKRQMELTLPVAGPSMSSTSHSSLRGTRSSSREIFVVPDSPKGKSKRKAETPVSTMPTARLGRLPRLMPYVSVPPRNTPSRVKVEKISPKKSPNLRIGTGTVADPTEYPSKRHKVNQTTQEDATSSSSSLDSATSAASSSSAINNEPRPLSSANSVSSSSVSTEILQKAASRPRSSRVHLDAGQSSPTTNTIPKSESVIKSDKRPSSKANVFVLPQSVTVGYLQSSPTLEIEPPPVDVAITRDDLRVAYGGSNQQFLQYFEEGKNPSGPNRRHLVFPMVEMNPAMPFVPGEPGLIYASRHEILYDPPWTLFIKPDPKKSIWRYLGEYECVICGVMSAEMFRSQTDVVKTTWAKFLLKMKAFDVYVLMRVRIALRKAKVLPIVLKDDKDEEAKKEAADREKELIRREMDAVKRRTPEYEVNEADIAEAFSNGDEAIDIIRMTCVKYDQVFVKDMQDKLDIIDDLRAADRKRVAKKAKLAPSKRLSLSRKRGLRESAVNSSVESGSDTVEVETDVNSDSEFQGGGYGASTASSTSTRVVRPRRSTRMRISHMYDSEVDTDRDDIY